MSKPDWCPQDVWDEAEDMSLDAIMERAILAAKTEEREAILQIVNGEFLRNRHGEICIIDENASTGRIVAAIRKRGEPKP